MIEKLLISWNLTKIWTRMTVSFLFVVIAMATVWTNLDSGINAPSQNASTRGGAVGTAYFPEPWGGCLQQAAHASGVHPAIFEAIVKVESGRHPYAFGWYDENRKWRSYKARTYADAVAHLRTLEQQRVRFDVGLAQVNSRNLKALSQRTGLSSLHALEPCANLHLASVILREQIKLHGRTWKAIAGYNGAVTYAPKVFRAYCIQVPDALHCRSRVPVSHLLSYPLPVLQPATPSASNRNNLVNAPRTSIGATVG
jgi:soluble lytic murein transglycosylase-like protein